MKMYGEIKVKLGAFITSDLDEENRSVSRSGCLMPVERTPNAFEWADGQELGPVRTR
jgi:hypothetical protein